MQAYKLKFLYIGYCRIYFKFLCCKSFYANKTADIYIYYNYMTRKILFIAVLLANALQMKAQELQE